MDEHLDNLDTCDSDTPRVTIVDVDPIARIFTIVRRDMVTHECLVCEEGTYRQSDFESSVRCDVCTDYAPRWMTKHEMAKHTMEQLL